MRRLRRYSKATESSVGASLEASFEVHAFIFEGFFFSFGEIIFEAVGRFEKEIHTLPMP